MNEAHEVLDLDTSDEATEEISDWFTLNGENEDKWNNGEYIGADKP